MKYNIGFADLFLRFIIGLIIVLAKAYGVLPSGALGAVLILVAIIFIGTAALGKCPIYHVLGISTKKSEA